MPLCDIVPSCMLTPSMTASSPIFRPPLMRAVESLDAGAGIDAGQERNELHGVARRTGGNEQRQLIYDLRRHALLLRAVIVIELRGIGADFYFCGSIANLHGRINAGRLIREQLDVLLLVGAKALRRDA